MCGPAHTAHVCADPTTAPPLHCTKHIRHACTLPCLDNPSMCLECLLPAPSASLTPETVTWGFALSTQCWRDPCAVGGNGGGGGEGLPHSHHISPPSPCSSFPISVPLPPALFPKGIFPALLVWAERQRAKREGSEGGPPYEPLVAGGGPALQLGVAAIAVGVIASQLWLDYLR